MKQISLFLCLLVSQSILAQKSSLVIVPSAKDSIIMPNALKGQNFGLKYQSNNGQGFDIYESGIDRMPVLMPDKNNSASLGLNKTENQPSFQPFKKYQPAQVLPNNNQGLQFQNDSLIITPKKFKKQ
ncbi:MAG: hypothetical protein CFE25_10180 [Chitinophagaceae bacterium BSSC1]|nr:MAG: hypothetical protein CFE25_10180 [Chitinophagaceae bacterium BSSC1]